MSSPSAPFLPPHLLEQLGGLDVIARAIVRGFLAGKHRSPLRGAGEEFARHRDYQQGDDVRRLDWKLYGRTDRLFVREYEERSNLRALLLVDATASMGYGDEGPSKLRYAAYVAAALAHLMLRAGDAVGLATLGREARLLAPPRSRRGQSHEILLHLEHLAADGDGALDALLALAGAALPARSRVVLISDLLAEDDGAALLAGVGALRARGDEVMVLRVLTATEAGDRALPDAAYFDPERPTAPRAAATGRDAGYTARVGAYYARIEAALRARGAEYLATTTDRPVETVLGGWLRARAAA